MRRNFSLVLLSGLLSSILLAQQVDVPLRNWTVPPYTQASSAGGGGITTMTDVTSPRAFIGVQPCRIVDTRAGSGFPAGYGPPSMAAGVPRNFDLNNGPCPGLPATIDAYSLNVTVTNTAGEGFIKIWPQGGAVPDVSSLNYVAGQTVANAVIVPAGTGGGVTAVAGVSGTDLIIDINGYFSYTLGTPSNSFLVSNNSPFPSIGGVNASTAAYAMAVAGVMSATTPGFGSAGVSGQVGAFTSCVTCLTFPAGVRGVGGSDHTAVLGISSTGYAVDGYTTGGTGMYPVAEGALGVPGTPFNYGVYANGNYGGTGAKYFVEPHPSDPAKVIRYIALEGPEPGTYFRGRGRFVRGIARIAVSKDFRMVTDEEGLSVQITPIGAMASFAVLRADLTEIVVQSSRNVEFYYLVQGIRRTHKHLTSPITEGREYMPRSAESTMPLYLTEGQKQLLIGNGTYSADGTVNLETARRLGWDRVWAERDRPTPQPE